MDLIFEGRDRERNGEELGSGEKGGDFFFFFLFYEFENLIG